ncbi:MAG: tryptophan-rich sensory protein [Clostridia bacterium]|nr:tryptophan-rich sensory protein [Clostridia bacterium]
MTRPKIDWKVLLFFLLYTFILAGIGTLLGGGFDIDSLNKPPLAPPAWLFPIVWTVLYALMSIAAYLVFMSNDLDRGPSLRLYLLQVAVNALWPLLFFRLEWRLFAFFWLLLLILLVVLTMIGFRRINRTAFRLLIPYLLWIAFAAYLNLGFYLLNR